jgi:ABC-type multidrug transport system permease subunit
VKRQLRSIAALMRRGLNEILRVPGGARRRMLQGAGFTGAATGVNLARDIEQGWFDRLLLSPTPRAVLLAGVVGSASLRALLPATFTVALALGVHRPGVLAIALAALLVMGLAAAAACYAILIALRFRTQQAAPLMQVGTFVAVLFTTAYAPRELLSDWLRTLADINPVTHVPEGARQGFVGDVTWATTWPALLAVAGLIAVFARWPCAGCAGRAHSSGRSVLSAAGRGASTRRWAQSRCS